MATKIAKRVIGAVLLPLILLVGLLFSLEQTAQAQETVPSSIHSVELSLFDIGLEQVPGCPDFSGQLYQRFAFGYVEQAGAMVGAGHVVSATDEAGNVVGCQVTRDEGIMPFIAIYPVGFGDSGLSFHLDGKAINSSPKIPSWWKMGFEEYVYLADREFGPSDIHFYLTKNASIMVHAIDASGAPVGGVPIEMTGHFSSEEITDGKYGEVVWYLGPNSMGAYTITTPAAIHAVESVGDLYVREITYTVETADLSTSISAPAEVEVDESLILTWMVDLPGDPPFEAVLEMNGYRYEMAHDPRLRLGGTMTISRTFTQTGVVTATAITTPLGGLVDPDWSNNTATFTVTVVEAPLPPVWTVFLPTLDGGGVRPPDGGEPVSGPSLRLDPSFPLPCVLDPSICTDLQVALTVEPTEIYAGEQVTVTVIITNNGSASKVSSILQMPNGLEKNWDDDDFAEGEMKVYTVTVELGESFTFTATATSDRPELRPSDNTDFAIVTVIENFPVIWLQFYLPVVVRAGPRE